MTLIWFHNPNYEAEAVIAPVYKQYDCKIDLKFTYVNKKAEHFYHRIFMIVSNIFIDKWINSCEDPSRYNVKRLYIYAKDVKEFSNTCHMYV